jgi:hypothetical protein
MKYTFKISMNVKVPIGVPLPTMIHCVIDAKRGSLFLQQILQYIEWMRLSHLQVKYNEYSS